MNAIGAGCVDEFAAVASAGAALSARHAASTVHRWDRIIPRHLEENAMTNGISESGLDFRRMTSGDRPEVFKLLAEYFTGDPFYRESAPAYQGGETEREATEAALAAALALFVDRPDYGFIWLAFEAGSLVGCAAVGYSISLSLGRVVASLDALVVAPAARRRGIGVELVESLIVQLENAEVARLDVGVHQRNEGARNFFAGLGFEATHDERMALVLA